MRGHPSGTCELLPIPAGESLAGNGTAAPVVRADFDRTLLVGPAELDAIEAFLMLQIRALLNDEASPKPVQSDSEVPQTPAKIRMRKA